jgi:Gluconate 2-dehydrogenase subunit 3
MATDFRKPHHLPKVQGGEGADPYGLPRQRRGTTPQMHGRYPDFDCLDESGHWDELTRSVVTARLEQTLELRFFSEAEASTLAAFCDVILAQASEPRIPVLAFVDEKLADGRLDGYQYAGMPDDRETWRIVARGLDEAAQRQGAASYGEAPVALQRAVADDFAAGAPDGAAWAELSVERAWGVVMRSVLAAFYSHPWAWNEIGFRGPAYPRGYMRRNMGPAGADPDEPVEAFGLDPVRDLERRA